MYQYPEQFTVIVKTLQILLDVIKAYFLLLFKHSHYGQFFFFFCYLGIWKEKAINYNYYPFRIIFHFYILRSAIKKYSV